MTGLLPKLPPGVLSEGVLKIDFTGYSKIETCETLGWYEQAWRRVPEGRDEALGFGAAIHAALDLRQKWLMRKAEGSESLPSLSKTERADLQTAVEELLEREFSEEVNCSQPHEIGEPCDRCGGTMVVRRPIQLPDDEHRTLGRAKEVMGEYLEKYPAENFRILASELRGEKELGTVKWTETPPDGYCERFHTCRVIWQGRTDGIWQDPADGKCWIKDTKTMREVDWDRETVKYKMGAQLKLYCWLFSEPDRLIRDAVVDVIVVRPPLKRVSAASKPRTELERLPFSFTDSQIDQCRQDVLRRLSVWLTWCGSHVEPPPMRTSACAWPRPCPFVQVCENVRLEDRLRWLSGGKFKDNTWNPMED